MTKDEAIAVLYMVEAHGLADEAKRMAIEALQADIVRCKDCKWYDKGENEVSTWSICTRTMGIKDSVIDTDYCSFAERREDGRA